MLRSGSGLLLYYTYNEGASGKISRLFRHRLLDRLLTVTVSLKALDGFWDWVLSGSGVC